MNTITVTKKEYESLLDKALRYEYIKREMASDAFSVPPLKNKKAVVSAFKNTKLYNKDFISSLERGLKRSTYFKK
ncbi:hypothetical protein A2733_01070 [Candidatus Nomurabacteria bacterium RIFCSPHIGHO2_01_FULL_40_20]|uniref:Uncharacterized protein n=1 Tax=Candidatus Nomurabacteria bacterium RIFCSPHIGHO2_01_FULL_40_20 TaxID=1801738 RepID=A0A1F6V2U8_9BACT|nr:MAG: hypothetical protein A2733_01070 [Candidatus Nomurabacteria bacterium RIFCSPHIGHO2_01_FULL_40_20]